MALTKEEIKWATVMALTTPRKVPKPPYLTFYSPDGEFTLSVNQQQKTWNGALEWSTDTATWTEWDGTTALSSSDRHLYLRGIGNNRITAGGNGNSFRFTGENIECSGNIETLLDYSTVFAGEHPEMAASCCYAMFAGCTNLVSAPELPNTSLSTACYYRMFEDCTGLVTAPELPATTLADYCYEYMFYGCTSLTTAPELPATTLAMRCYLYMFYGCTSLTTAPALPATTLTMSCYYAMFYGCTSLTTIPKLPATELIYECYDTMFYLCRSLRLSTMQDATYQYPYRIPTSGTGTDVYSALNFMFAHTGGTFTGTPSINTTYYTDHEPV